ncbi:MAG: MBL fold metallo-hydrolase [Planctomycetes bacterium]|nr:MBL fold metallo-hydrolase [Planctomycetota bacterium]
MRVKVWGCRGSVPCPGLNTVKYGGNTSCYEVLTGDGRHFVLDGGTGIWPLGRALAALGTGQRITVLFNHTHWDHIAGFAFFEPLFVAGNRIDAYGPFNLVDQGKSFERTMQVQWDRQFYPHRFTGIAALLEYHEMREGVTDFGGVTVRSHFMNHSIQALGYRVSVGGKSLFYTGDTEPYRNPWADGEAGSGAKASPAAETTSSGLWDDDDHFGEQAGAIIEMRNNQIVELCRDVDLLICDAQYTAEEYRTKVGWGHTSIPDAVDMGVKAGARRIGLSHHEPLHDDARLDALEAWARDYARGKGFTGEVFMTREGQEVTL